MKVLAVDGNPSTCLGSAGMLLGSFLDGMSSAGAEIQLLKADRLKINPCTAELDCWLVSPGYCRQQDSMNDLYPDLLQADIWVFATPVQGHRMAGTVQNFLDRTLPLAIPNLEIRDGHSRHGLRYSAKQGKVVFIAGCELWERDSLDAAVAHVQATCQTLGREFAGALLRPHDWILRVRRGPALDQVLASAREAGQQLATKGAIAPETLAAVSQDLIGLDDSVRAFNELLENEFTASMAGSCIYRWPASFRQARRKGFLSRIISARA
jgi:multimeric flavodoxin WrbA